MKYKKLFLFVFCTIIILTFSGCGKSDNTKDSPTIIPVKNDDPLKKDSETPVHSENSITEIPDNNISASPDFVTNDTDKLPNTKDDIPSPTKEPVSDTVQNPVIIVLDPGHGGKFDGAVYSGLVEKNMTFYLANYLKEYLLENYKDIEVYMTRESDIALDEDIVKELEIRAIIAKEKNADYFISLHFNASEDHSQIGASVYASRRSNVTEASQGLAKAILVELVKYGLKDHGIGLRASSDHFDTDGSALDYYAVLRHNAARDIPAVIVEHCFMDNPADREFIDTDEKLEALAEADARGIAEYLQLVHK